MKRPSILLIHLCLLLVLFTPAVFCDDSTWDWTEQIGSTSSDYGYDVALDSEGNIFVTGYVNGDLPIGGGSYGGADYFILKYNSSGSLIWGKQIGSAATDIGNGIALDSSGNIYVTGYTSGDLGGTGNAGGNDIFVAKFNSFGTNLWTVQHGTSGSDEGQDIALDSSGNIYVTGSTAGNLDGNTTAGSIDIFIMKLDNDGNWQWTKQPGTSLTDNGYGITVDSSGNVYVTGSAGGELDGEPYIDKGDAFITKYNSSGVRQWTKVFGTAEGDLGYSIAMMPGNASVCMTGIFNAASWGDGDLGIYTCDADGTAVTEFAYLDEASTTWGIDIAVDDYSNIYVTGFTAVSLDGNPYYGYLDILAVKYNPSGQRLWSRINGTVDGEVGYGIGVDEFGNVYVAGFAQTALNGNPSYGGDDIVLLKYGADYNISGTVTDGTNPISGVTLNLTGASTANTLSDALGEFSFNNLNPGGTFIVTPSKTNYTFSPSSRTYTGLDHEITDADFTGTLNTWDISGTITDGTNPMSGVTVNLTGGATLNTTTTASGDFNFVNLNAGTTYIITPSFTVYTFSPVTRTYSDLSADVTDADFTGTENLFDEINPGDLTGVSFGFPQLGDFDNDGDLDLVLSGTSDTGAFTMVYRNNGTGHFSEINPNGLTPSIHQCVTGDLDNDGDLDIIQGDKIYLNDGTGFFTEHATLPTDPYYPIVLGDLDNDGDLDLIHGFKIFQNDGSAGFTEINIGHISLPGAEMNSVLGDLDNDGDLDLIVSGSGEFPSFVNMVFVYKNDGNAGFSSGFSDGLGSSNLPTLSAGDVDNDGDIDFIAISYSSYLFRNDGTGNFTKIDMGITNKWIGSSIISGDFDNDGDLDFFVQGIYNLVEDHALYYNDGSGSFTCESILYIQALKYQNSVFGDIDNDGDLDLIITGTGNTGRISQIFKNMESTVNLTPGIPSNPSVTSVGGFWNFTWTASSDDHTSNVMLRYNIAVSTSGSGIYNYISDAIAYPRGQAVVGNIPQDGTVTYQSSIPDTVPIWFKVCALDTSFKYSDYSTEYQSHCLISGVIQDGVGNPIQNITINLTGDGTGSLVTSSTGYYEFCVRSELNYTVTPDSVIWNFTPVNYSYSNITSYQLNQDFTGSITSIISPTQLAADLISLTQVNLTWTDNSDNEDGFRIERRDGDAGVWTQIGSVGAGVTAFSDTSGLNRAINYYYRVYAWNSLGNSGYSNEERVRFKALDTEFKVYPNPVKPGDSVRFANLNGPGTIKILDTYGNLIKEISFAGTEATWDLTGSVAPGSGVYIYHIKDNNGTKTGKIILIN